MTAVISAGAPSRGSLVGLELGRFVRNPVFLIGVAATAYTIWYEQRTVATDIDTFLCYPAIFLGGFGMMAGYWLTRSMNRSAEVVDVAPTSLPRRTAALCATAVVPFLLGWVAVSLIVRYQPIAGEWVFGTFGTTDQAAVWISSIVLPSLGGPLLGVALGRWVRFPGTAFLSFLAIYGWVTLTYILATAHPDSLAFRMLRLFSPFAFFTTVPDSGGVLTWSGSPWFYLGWQVCLCAIAVFVAMLRGAEGAVRRRIGIALAAVSIAAAVAYALAVAF